MQKKYVYLQFGKPDNSLTSFMGVELLTRTEEIILRSSIHIGQTQSDFNQLGLIDNIEDTYFSSFGDVISY